MKNIHKYSVSQKVYLPWRFIITSTNVDWFSKFFHQLIRWKIIYTVSETRTNSILAVTLTNLDNFS